MDMAYTLTYWVFGIGVVHVILYSIVALMETLIWFIGKIAKHKKILGLLFIYAWNKKSFHEWLRQKGTPIERGILACHTGEQFKREQFENDEEYVDYMKTAGEVMPREKF
jgi:hypothetical protein